MDAVRAPTVPGTGVSMERGERGIISVVAFRHGWTAAAHSTPQKRSAAGIAPVTQLYQSSCKAKRIYKLERGQKLLIYSLIYSIQQDSAFDILQSVFCNSE